MRHYNSKTGELIMRANMRFFKLWRKGRNTPEYNLLEEDIWQYVQAHDGSMEIGKYTIEFRVPEKYADFLLMKHPEIEETTEEWVQ